MNFNIDYPLNYSSINILLFDYFICKSPVSVPTIKVSLIYMNTSISVSN